MKTKTRIDLLKLKQKLKVISKTKTNTKKQ